MSAPAALVPIEQREVEFYGDQILAVLAPTEELGTPQVFVPVRPVVEYLGLSWSGQRERIRRDPVLSDVARGVRVTRPPQQGGEQEMLCLPIEYLNGWLFGVSTNRLGEGLREKVIRYQRECYRVLWQAFQAEMLSALGARHPPSSLAQIRDMGLAIVQLAEQQMALEARTGANEARLDRAAQVVAQIGRRLTTVERRVAPGQPITEEQAAEISQQVKALVDVLTGHDPAKNHYQSVFGELYRRFSVTSYKNIPIDHFAAVMDFLEGWKASALKGPARTKGGEDV